MPGGLPPDPAIDPGDVTDVTGAAEAWLEAYADLLRPSGAAAVPWRDDRLEYEFAVGARTSGGQVALTAREYDGGHLDWYSFDRHPSATVGAGSDPQPDEIARTLVPTPIRYKGMPSPRYWEWENEQASFPDIEAAADDLGRMLLVEFALVYGSDFFYVPVELEIGSLCTTRSLVVTDTFGERTLVKPSAWPMAGSAHGGCSRWPTTGSSRRPPPRGTRCSCSRRYSGRASAARSSRRSCCSETRWRTWRGPSSEGRVAGRAPARPAPGAPGARQREEQAQELASQARPRPAAGPCNTGR